MAWTASAICRYSKYATIRSLTPTVPPILVLNNPSRLNLKMKTTNPLPKGYYAEFRFMVALALAGGSKLRNPIKKLQEMLTFAAYGSASPNGTVFYETSDIPLADIMQLYYRDATCKSSVDLLAASTVGMGFYTTVDEKYAKATKAKACVDEFLRRHQP